MDCASDNGGQDFQISKYVLQIYVILVTIVPKTFQYTVLCPVETTFS